MTEPPSYARDGSLLERIGSCLAARHQTRPHDEETREHPRCVHPPPLKPTLVYSASTDCAEQCQTLPNEMRKKWQDRRRDPANHEASGGSTRDELA